MKSHKILKPALIIMTASFLYLSCTRDNPQVAILDTNSTNSATVQVFSATLKAARNAVYVDNTPVSGTVFAYQAVFPGIAYSFKVAAGMHTFLIKDTASTTTQSPLSFSATLDAGKSYTVFTYDTITSAKQLTVKNNIVIPKDTTCMLRFANFIYSTSVIPNVDVYSFRRGNAAPVFSNLATAQVTDFIPYASGLTDTLYVYAAGTTSPLLLKGFVTSLTPTRSYTATFNGSYKGTKAVTSFATY